MARRKIRSARTSRGAAKRVRAKTSGRAGKRVSKSHKSRGTLARMGKKIERGLGLGRR